MDMRQDRRRVPDHLGNVGAEIEGMRRTIEELDVFRANHTDHVDRGMNRLAPVFGMRFDVEVDPLLFEYGDKLLHRAPPGRLAGLMRELAAAAVGAMASIRRGAAAELAVHRVDAHLDRDRDRFLPISHGGLALVLVRTRPTIHREQRRDLHAVVLQRLLEARDTLGIGAWIDPPGQEVVAG